MRLNRYSDKKINETVINTKTFNKIKVVIPCKKKIFEKFPDESFIIVLDNNGKVLVYENKKLNTYKNLREFVGLFGSKFFKNPITNTELGENMKDFYEKETGQSVRDIYKFNFEI